MSCPSRGTWIEIGYYIVNESGMFDVVPLTGHVDRNVQIA